MNMVMPALLCFRRDADENVQNDMLLHGHAPD